jgi:hypothetical protein
MTDKKTPAPRPTPRRTNASTDGHLSGQEMRTAKHVADTERVVREWLAYRDSTPIAVETFVPASLCQALDALAEEVAP